MEARAASATTCPDYRPLWSSLEARAAYVINPEMYEFEGLGYEGGYGGYGNPKGGYGKGYGNQKGGYGKGFGKNGKGKGAYGLDMPSAPSTEQLPPMW